MKATKKVIQKKPLGFVKKISVLGLWFAALMSAVLVVYATFLVRASTHELELLKRESATLDVESGQLLLEKSVWSNYSRIERIAKEDLKMIVPNGGQVVLVRKN